MSATLPGSATRRLASRGCMVLLTATVVSACTVRPSQDDQEDRDPDYVRTYAEEGAPAAEPFVEVLDLTTFPPRLRAAAVADTPSIRPSPFDVTDTELENARRAALSDDRVGRALGERFVEITIGAGAPDKPDTMPADAPPIGIEWFSYSNERAVRATVLDRRLIDLQVLPPEYQPAETLQEVEEAVSIVARDPRLGPLTRGTEADGILSVCEQSARCLYVRFLRPDGVVALAAEVDLIERRVLDVDVDPDADVR
jgi:hypothetical protein